MKIYKNGKLVKTETIYYDDIFCMSNLRGNNIVVPHKLPFSFYFSIKNSSHAIRVKVLFNPTGVKLNLFGTLELHGDWHYEPGPNDKNVSSKQIREMKQFFRKYKVLFAGVWENEILDTAVSDYFRGKASFYELLQECFFYEDYQEEMDKIKNVEELEQFVREYDIFNMWD